MGELRSLNDAVNDAFVSLLPEDERFGKQSGGAWAEYIPLEERFACNLARQNFTEKHIASKKSEARSHLVLGLKLCETPIEKHILPHLLFEFYGRSIQAPIPICDPKSNDRLPPAGELFIVPQMAFVRFRVDFALIRRLPKGLGIVAFECDGEDFHFAQRDTLRDGWLASFQIKTVRANGKQIYKEPSLVAARVAEAVMELV